MAPFYLSITTTVFTALVIFSANSRGAQDPLLLEFQKRQARLTQDAETKKEEEHRHQHQRQLRELMGGDHPPSLLSGTQETNVFLEMMGLIEAKNVEVYGESWVADTEKLPAPETSAISLSPESIDVPWNLFFEAQQGIFCSDAEPSAAKLKFSAAKKFFGDVSLNSLFQDVEGWSQGQSACAESTINYDLYYEKDFKKKSYTCKAAVFYRPFKYSFGDGPQTQTLSLYLDTICYHESGHAIGGMHFYVPELKLLLWRGAGYQASHEAMVQPSTTNFGESSRERFYNLQAHSRRLRDEARLQAIHKVIEDSLGLPRTTFVLAGDRTNNWLLEILDQLKASEAKVIKNNSTENNSIESETEKTGTPWSLWSLVSLFENEPEPDIQPQNVSSPGTRSETFFQYLSDCQKFVDFFTLDQNLDGKSRDEFQWGDIFFHDTREIAKNSRRGGCVKSNEDYTLLYSTQRNEIEFLCSAKIAYGISDYQFVNPDSKDRINRRDEDRNRQTLSVRIKEECLSETEEINTTRWFFPEFKMWATEKKRNRQ